MFRCNRDLAMGRVQPPRIRKAEAPSQRDVDTMTTVVIVCRANVETISCMQRPGGSCCGIVVNQSFCSKRGKGRLVEIEWAIKFLVG
jgi:hypothetical protein